METLEILVYSYNELSQEAKDRAIGDYSNKMQITTDDLDHIIEGAKEEAEQLGFKDPEFSYSLGNCQGDGLSFKCSYIDTAKFMRALWPGVKTSVLDLICNNIEFFGRGNTGRYCYAMPGDIEMMIHFYKDLPNIEKMADQLHDYIQDQYINLCAKTEKIGYQEIEYLQSEEHIAEIFEINEMKFTENGKIFNY